MPAGMQPHAQVVQSLHYFYFSVRVLNASAWIYLYIVLFLGICYCFFFYSCSSESEKTTEYISFPKTLLSLWSFHIAKQKGGDLINHEKLRNKREAVEMYWQIGFYPLNFNTFCSKIWILYIIHIHKMFISAFRSLSLTFKQLFISIFMSTG